MAMSIGSLRKSIFVAQWVIGYSEGICRLARGISEFNQGFCWLNQAMWAVKGIVSQDGG
jgi:hypothetical protein